MPHQCVNFFLNKTFFFRTRIHTTSEQVTPIIKGFHGCADETPMALPEQLSWASGGDEPIAAAFAFLAAEAELLARAFVPPAVKAFTESWVSSWDGGVARNGELEEWLGSAVRVSSCVVFLLRRNVVVIVRPRKPLDQSKERVCVEQLRVERSRIGTWSKAT